MCLLAIGFASYHAHPSKFTQALDHSGTYAAMMYLVVHHWAPAAAAGAEGLFLPTRMLVPAMGVLFALSVWRTLSAVPVFAPACVLWNVGKRRWDNDDDNETTPWYARCCHGACHVRDVSGEGGVSPVHLRRATELPANFTGACSVIRSFRSSPLYCGNQQFGRNQMPDAPFANPRSTCPSHFASRIGSKGSLALVLLCGLVFAHSACGDPTAISDPANMVLHTVSGDSQVGLPYEELSDPIVVQVMDTASNEPVYDQVINFRVVEGDGTVYAGVAHTNEAGIAQEFWTLGRPGPQRLEARAVTGDGEKVVFGTFHATAIEPFDSEPAYVQCLNTEPTWRPSGDCEYGVQWVDSAVTASFRVLNADSIPIPDVLVRFTVDTSVDSLMQMGGSVSPDSALTDSLGTVTVTWTLSPYPGDNVLKVSAYGGSDVKSVFAWSHGVNPPSPHDSVPGHIRCLMPNSWWRYDGECNYGPQPVNSTIPVAFQVVARDSTPLSNIPMFFAVDTTALEEMAADGSVMPDSALTDSAGVAIVSWTLGQQQGRNRLIARAVGAGVTLTEVVEANGVSDSISMDSVPALIQCRDYHGIWRTDGLCAYYSVPEGTTFPAAFRVTNRDTVPLSGIAMEFEVTHGGGAVDPDSATTDGLGEVTVQWTVGSHDVGQQLVARVPSWNLEVAVRVGVNLPQPEKVWWENPAGGEWSNAANWSGGRIPRPGDTVLVVLPGTYTVSVQGVDQVSVGLFEIGSGDSTEAQTLAIDGAGFDVAGFGAVHPGGVIAVDSGGSYSGYGYLFVVGGRVHLLDGTWAHNTSLDSGAFVFAGTTPKTLESGQLRGNGGSMIWRSQDTLLVLEDSASVFLTGSELVVEDTLTILGGLSSFGLVMDSAARLVIHGSSSNSTYLQMNGVPIVLNGEVAIETTESPQPGTVFDLVRLVGGATCQGTPTLVTDGYTLQVNPEEGVGLRAVKND